MKNRLRAFARIRTRIALSIFGASVVSLVVMSAAVYVGFWEALLENLSDTLHSSALANVNLVDRNSNPPILLLADSQLLDIEDKEVVRLYDTNGHLLDDSDTSPHDVAGLAAEREVALAALDGDLSQRSVRISNVTFR